MLIDEFMPVYDFSERHETKIRASRERVFEALNSADLSDSWIIRGLFALRGLGWSRASEKSTLRGMTKAGFALLGEKPHEEILLGLAGKFWTLSGSLQKLDAGNFREFNEKGFAKAAWNFSLSESEGETRLKTETRIQCLDEDSRQSFALYWTVIKPFSGLTRAEMLRVIKQKAEDAHRKPESS
jgi:hypothetical protein